MIHFAQKLKLFSTILLISSLSCFTLYHYLSLNSVFAQEDTGWSIRNFDAIITINKNASVDVVEKITADFGQLQKHGIYRIVPVKYKTQSGNNLDIHFKLNSVTDENNKLIAVQQSREGRNIKLKIGNADKTITGIQTYIISYQVNRVITRPAENAEFYWNVTGSNWPVAINQTTAIINSPKNSILNSICFDSFDVEPLEPDKEQVCDPQHDGSTAQFRAAHLSPGQELTIAVELDKNRLTFPSFWQNLIWFLSDNWLYGIPFLTLVLMLHLYWIKGRDKQYKNIFAETGEVKTVPLFEKLDPLMVFAPPENLSPGEVGALADETIHLRDITAVVIDLARRGFFKIKEIPKKGLFGRVDFEFNFQNKPETDLNEFEKSVLDMLFSKKRTGLIKLSKLPKSAYIHLEKARDNLYKHLTEQGYFSGNPKSVRNFWLITGFLTAGSGIMYSIFANSPGGIFAGIASGLVIIAFSFFMPARTAKGRKALKEVIGLKEWIRLGAWREQIHEKHNFFEEVLPYTIVFGLTQKFIKAFNQADIKNLDWYQGAQTMNIAHFTNSMNSISSSLNSGISATRPRGASSGGSAFSGGGFSGGGFGGGGGGSW